MMRNYKKCISMDISLPEEIISEIDRARRYVTKSLHFKGTLAELLLTEKRNVAANMATRTNMLLRKMRRRLAEMPSKETGNIPDLVVSQCIFGYNNDDNCPSSWINQDGGYRRQL